MKCLEIGSKMEKKELGKIIGGYVHECSDTELFELLKSIKEEIVSRIAHVEEGWEHYWDKSELK